MVRDTSCWECIAQELTKSRDEVDATMAYAIRRALSSPIAGYRLGELHAADLEHSRRIEQIAAICQTERVRCA